MERIYIGITIGPIVEVLQNAKKTRELWAGSYLFSYLMKAIATGLQAKGYTLLSPVFEPALLNKHTGVGMFHDRCIAESHEAAGDAADDIACVIMAAKDALAEIIVDIPPSHGAQKTAVLVYLDKFLQISWVVTELNHGDNIFIEINRLLDSAELQRSFITEPDKHKIFTITGTDVANKEVDPIAYLQYRVNASALKKEAFGNGAQSRFLSMPEIAGREIGISYGDDDDKDPYPPDCTLKYKYAALIQADGDNVGALVKKVANDPAAAREFSKALFSFAAEVPSIAAVFGAQVVYAGGDDVLSFAPIVFKDFTVFDYLAALDNRFREIMRALEDRYPEAAYLSLSFGVAAVYYKFPLYEALEQARHNLFAGAKQYGRPDKNAVVFELIKHSGLSLKNIFFLNDKEVREPFQNLLKSELKGDSAIPHGFQHSLTEYAHIIEHLSTRPDFSDRIGYLFENCFNEDVHSGNVQKGIDLARELLEGFYKFYRNGKKSFFDFTGDTSRNNLSGVFQEFFSALSIIKHLRGDR